MESFVPELNAMNATLEEHLAAVADRVVREVLHTDRSEAAVVDDEPRQLQAAPAAAASGE